MSFSWAGLSLMNGPIKFEPRGSEFLRALSFLSAISLFFHVAALPIWFGFGSLLIFVVPIEYKVIGYFLIVTAVLSLATFCLSTQFYIDSKRRQ